MLKEIKKFYKKTKLRKVEEGDSEDQPITYTKVFYKEYPRLPSIDLIKIPEESELETLLEMRQSYRTFSDEPIKFKEISKILRSCRIIDKKREPERRTYPSGGARFPIELYLISFNIDGLDKGAYHYNMPKERLELLLKKDLTKFKRELISPYLENPAAIIAFASVIQRSEVKYGLKAYPYSLIEVGHMGQNIHLACSEIGVGSCSVSGFVDKTLSTILDLTDEEIPIYTISIGKGKFIS